MAEPGEDTIGDPRKRTERQGRDRGHYDDMFSAVHRRFDRVEVRLDEIDRRRPGIG